MKYFVYILYPFQHLTSMFCNRTSYTRWNDASQYSINHQNYSTVKTFILIKYVLKREKYL